MRNVFLFFFLFQITTLSAQDGSGFIEGATQLDSRDLTVDDSIPRTHDWRMKSMFGLNGTQSSFVNWNAGGRNNITLMAYISSSANYTHKKFKWLNDLNLALGGLQYVGKDAGDEGLQKTDDRIELSSTVGREVRKNYFVSMAAGFRTQFLDGFTYPNDSVRVSTFMAPGYLSLALGMDYTPNDNFSAFLSPLAAKMTFVRDQRLADAGSFGVTPAEYDVTTGDVITHGKMFRGEVGAYCKVTFQKEIFKNINVKSKLELFSNYLNNPENIDVNADVLFTFKVNSWFSASLNLTTLYDHDINILDSKGGFGPRTQFKSVLGIGVSYTLKNFKEK